MLFAAFGVLLFWFPLKMIRLKHRLAFLLFLAGFLSYVLTAFMYSWSDAYYDRMNVISMMLYLVPMFYLFGCYAWYSAYLSNAEVAGAGAYSQETYDAAADRVMGSGARHMAG
ncbi:hypothetical protein KCX80_21850 [Paenibacillus mucilaginosus]|uniref:Uncharacterized protein n=2 Tax=Paenibacillus mucilaginosus TaxID=61624 RepID=F8F6Q2_PAEMK|nr:hypothetical protein KNP414_05044 [Paenibacillus mucilaginosus KNP414]WDM25105.1 hypothetical protein KCX80_21850 [Paenibacillus mucilaginosus]